MARTVHFTSQNKFSRTTEWVLAGTMLSKYLLKWTQDVPGKGKHSFPGKVSLRGTGPKSVLGPPRGPPAGLEVVLTSKVAAENSSPEVSYCHLGPLVISCQGGSSLRVWGSLPSVPLRGIAESFAGAFCLPCHGQMKEEQPCVGLGFWGSCPLTRQAFVSLFPVNPNILTCFYLKEDQWRDKWACFLFTVRIEVCLLQVFEHFLSFNSANFACSLFRQAPGFLLGAGTENGPVSQRWQRQTHLEGSDMGQLMPKSSQAPNGEHGVALWERWHLTGPYEVSLLKSHSRGTVALLHTPRGSLEVASPLPEGHVGRSREAHRRGPDGMTEVSADVWVHGRHQEQMPGLCPTPASTPGRFKCPAPT